MWRILLPAALFFLLMAQPGRSCAISGFSPAQAQGGATLTLTGSGFTGASSVTFTLNAAEGSSTRTTSASFAVLSDTEMTVTVPQLNIQVGYFITVVASSGATVTLEPGATIVGSGTSSAEPAKASCAYILAGGTLTSLNTSSIAFVKNGGTLTGNGLSLDTVYAEPGAKVNVPGATVIQVPSITESSVSLLFQYGSYSGPTTDAASNVGTTTATVNGNTNTSMIPVGVYFEYGITSNYGSQTPTQSVQPFQSAQVLASLTNLAPNTLYHYCIVANNGAGPMAGNDMTFTTVPLSSGLPAVVANEPASMVTATGATLHALANPDGLATTIYFRLFGNLGGDFLKRWKGQVCPGRKERGCGT